jgi:chitinase
MRTMGGAAMAGALLAAACGPAPAAGPVKWITGYYAAQNGVQPAASIPWHHFTHICHFAAAPGPAGTVAMHYLTPEDIARFIASRPRGKKAIVTLMDGEAGFADATSPAHIAAFVAHIARFVKENGYDGVDIDWESRILVSQYNDLLRRLRPALRGKLLAMAAGNWGGLESVASASQSFLDQINVMCYDMDDTGEGYTWHNDALFQNGDASKMTADWRVRALTAAGVAKAKIGVGIPFYARRWTGATAPLQKGGKQVGWLPFRTLSTDPQRWQDAYRRWDATYSAEYLSIGPLNEFISFNGPRAIQETVSWAKAQGFGGVFAFTTDYEYVAAAAGEARYPLSTVLYNAVRGRAGSP